MDDSNSLPAVKIDLEQVGRMLRQAREDLNLSLRELAKMCGVSPAQVSRMETGEDFTLSMLVRLAVPLGLPPAWVVDASLSVSPGVMGARNQSALVSDAELSALVSESEGIDFVAMNFAVLDLVDLLTITACRLLVSSNPALELHAMAIPMPSLRRNFEVFIHAYGPETDSTERAAVFRAIVHRPLRKLRALSILTKEVVQEYLGQREERDKLLSSRLNYESSSSTTDSMPKTSSALSELVARAKQATSVRGAKVRLARDLGVSPQAVNQWLSGANAPSAELTLRLLAWVTAAEAKQ